MHSRCLLGKIGISETSYALIKDKLIACIEEKCKQKDTEASVVEIDMYLVLKI